MNKAKIKKRIVYSVLFMRDDSDVLRFRMSSFWLKFFVYSIILLIAVAAGAGFLSYHYWQKTVALESRLMTQEAQLKPLQEQMGRLDRLSSFAQAVDSQPPGELRPILQELGSSNATLKSQAENDPASGGMNGGLANNGQAHSGKPANGTDAVTSQNLAQNSAQSSAQPGGNATGSQTSVLPEAGADNLAGAGSGNATSGANATTALNSSAASNITSSASASPSIPAVENDDLKINNFVTRFSGRNKLRVNFDLNNIDTQRTIAGQVRLRLLDSAGQATAVKPDKDNASFRITFSKEFVLNYSLPEGMGAANISGFLLEVEDSSGTVIHSEHFSAPGT